MPPAIIGAAIGAAGSIGGALLGSSAAKKAAKAQAAATAAGIAEERRQFDLNRADLEPWRTAGGKAIGQGFAMLQPGYDYTTSPGYQFRLDEGLRGVQNSAAAKGLLQSGGTLKGIDKYSQNFAANDFNDQFNRLMAVSGGGQQAATSGASLGQSNANSIADLLTQAGNAKASGYIGSANAWSNGIGGLTSALSSLSDDDAKTNIVRLEDWDDRGDGLGKYEWNWKSAPNGEKQTGVIASEVEKLRPWALGPRLSNGWRTVNYAALSEIPVHGH